MIEMYREKLMGRSSATSGVGASGSAGAGVLNNGVAGGGGGGNNGGTTNANDPSALMQSHDESLSRFLNLLSTSGTEATTNDHTNPAPGATSASTSNEPQPTHSFTVPPSLSRRMLNRQGCGYIDPNVSNVASLAADRFLANIFHHASVCRDRRMKGQDLLERRRSDERRIRKRARTAKDVRDTKMEGREKGKEKECVVAIAAGDAVKSSSPGGNGDGTPTKLADGKTAPTTKKKKVKKKNAASSNTNGNKKTHTGIHKHKDESDDDASLYDDPPNYDFLDQTNSTNNSDEESLGDEEELEDEEEQRFVMHLRDLARPLQAWDINVGGKIGLGFPYHIIAPPSSYDDTLLTTNTSTNMPMSYNTNTESASTSIQQQQNPTNSKAKKMKKDPSGPTNPPMEKEGKKSDASSSVVGENAQKLKD